MTVPRRDMPCRTFRARRGSVTVPPDFLASQACAPQENTGQVDGVAGQAGVAAPVLTEVGAGLAMVDLAVEEVEMGAMAEMAEMAGVGVVAEVEVVEVIESMMEEL